MSLLPDPDRLVKSEPAPMPANVAPIRRPFPPRPEEVRRKISDGVAASVAIGVPQPRGRWPRAGKRGPWFGRWAKNRRPVTEDWRDPAPVAPLMPGHNYRPETLAGIHAAMRLPTEVERAQGIAAVFGRSWSCPRPVVRLGAERGSARPTGHPGRELRPWRWLAARFQGQPRLAMDVHPMRLQQGNVLVAAELVAEFGAELVAACLGIPPRVVRCWLDGRMAPPPHLVDRMLLWRATAAAPACLDPRD